MIDVRQNLVSPSSYGIKCPYGMVPKFIVVHNTANDASAENEISYMIRNVNEVSFHYAVDDKEVVQGIPTDRNAWHAGDGGNGQGNRYGIAYEICYSLSGGDRFNAAEKLAAKAIAQDLKARGWGIAQVKKHQDFSNKYCPHRTLDMGWQRFLNMVQAELNGSTLPVAPTPAPSKEKYGVGTPVCVNRIWSQSNGGQEHTGDWSGTITRVIQGAEHPYLIDDGNIGWTNDDAIDTDPHVPGSSIPTPEPSQPSGPKYGVGTKVTFTGLWTGSNGGVWYPKGSLLVKQGIITKVVPGAEHPYLIGVDLGWANDQCIDDEPTYYK